MKLHAIKIEKMIPNDQKERMIFRFDFQLRDGDERVPYGMQISVAVPLLEGAEYSDLRRAALDKLHATLLSLGAENRDGIDSAMATEFLVPPFL